MAQKRMLNKSISLSSQVNRLNLKHKLIFTWSVPHLDDYGLIENDPEVLKATVCPMVKDITVKDFREFIASASKVGLLVEYEDCLDFTGFDNHQSLSEEKKAKSKFSRIPKIPQENIGENNNPQNSPLQENRREDKGREVKIGEGNVALTNKQFFEIVQERGARLDALVDQMHEAVGVPKEVIRKEFIKFTSYWTEPTQNGKKLRHELEKTFEVKRRLSTWFQRAGQFKGSQNMGKYNPSMV